ncbi:hypothetical protein FRX31_027818 [Thalictrum thalictroides]|uniref:Uncharacterized protein n=1 Tax=Thalictrum thalictroides TaxID=46969 RepID=A0A7J6VBX5_THATH|nr:hypothetical protein FRX31_027818 [Thalictrum thalictroides]
MNGPKKKPLVVVSPPSFGDKRDVVFAIGSHPLTFIEKLSCDPSTGEWKWTVVSPPPEYPLLYYDFNLAFRAGFAKIDGNRKLLICCFGFKGLLIFDMDTNMWDCNFEDQLSTYAPIKEYGTYTGQVPIVDNVWYVLDNDEDVDDILLGFDLQTFKWSEVYNLDVEKFCTKSLVQIGDKSMGLVCVKTTIPQWEVYCTVFQVQKDLDGSLYACNLLKTPSYFGDGTTFLHCVVL